jgi:hypothetical protein
MMKFLLVEGRSQSTASKLFAFGTELSSAGERAVTDILVKADLYLWKIPCVHHVVFGPRR